MLGAISIYLYLLLTLASNSAPKICGEMSVKRTTFR